jgi:hypothetical protein
LTAKLHGSGSRVAEPLPLPTVERPVNLGVVLLIFRRARSWSISAGRGWYRQDGYKLLSLGVDDARGKALAVESYSRKENLRKRANGKRVLVVVNGTASEADIPQIKLLCASCVSVLAESPRVHRRHFLLRLSDSSLQFPHLRLHMDCPARE